MKKKIIPLLLLFGTFHVAHAVSIDGADPVVVDGQEMESDTYEPPVQNYGIVMVTPLIMDRLCHLDAKIALPFNHIRSFDWRSLFRVSPALLYAIRINRSRFALCIGVGYSILYYAFAPITGEGNDHGQSYPRLTRKSDCRVECENMESKKGKVLVRSTISIPFYDFLLRLRFNSVLDDPKQGLHGWLGIKFGFRTRAAMMMGYKAYDDVGASSVKQGHFNLKPYTFAGQVGVGYSHFGVTGGFHLTPLFKEGKGPIHSELLRPFFFGIYVSV